MSAVPARTPADAYYPYTAPLRHQSSDPFRQCESGRVHGGVVIVGFHLGARERFARARDADGRAETLARTGPRQRHEAADISRHDAQIESRMRKELGEFFERVGNFPRLIERNAGLKRCKASG